MLRLVVCCVVSCVLSGCVLFVDEVAVNEGPRPVDELDMSMAGGEMGEELDQGVEPQDDLVDDQDMDIEEDMGPVCPEPEVFDRQRCDERGRSCGVFVIGSEPCAPGGKTVNCGGCDGDAQCQGGECVEECQPREQELVCQAAGLRCGAHTVTECDEALDVVCGDRCTDEAPDCTPDGQCCNAAAELDVRRVELVAEGRCGAQPVVICGRDEMIDLGTSCGAYAVSQDRDPNHFTCNPVRRVCECVGETDTQLCGSNDLECGSRPNVIDRCGRSRSVDCGRCGFSLRPVCCADNTCRAVGFCR